MKVRKAKRRSGRTPEQAMAALRESRERYENSEAGKARKKKWVKDNRKAINAYKRAWRKRRKAASSAASIDF